MKKKKLKKRLDKLETAIFYQEQRIKELESLKPLLKTLQRKPYNLLTDERNPFMAVRITKIEEEEDNK